MSATREGPARSPEWKWAEPGTTLVPTIKLSPHLRNFRSRSTSGSGGNDIVGSGTVDSLQSVFEYPADEAIFDEYTLDIPEWIIERRRALWSEQHHTIADLIRLDGVSLYSVTDETISNIMTNILLEIAGNNNKCVTDATACVGGNTAALARVFKTVNAVEISPIRVEMLRHNLGVLGVRSNTRIIEGDYTKIYQILRQDIVLLDPPWGGPHYRQQRRIDLFLGHRNVAELTVELLRWGSNFDGSPRPPYAKIVAIKAPLNYNVFTLQRHLRLCGFNPTHCIKITNFDKMLFIIVNVKSCARIK